MDADLRARLWGLLLEDQARAKEALLCKKAIRNRQRRGRASISLAREWNSKGWESGKGWEDIDGEE